MLCCDENIFFFVHMYIMRIDLNQTSRQFKKKKEERFFLCVQCFKVSECWLMEKKYCRQYFVIQKKIRAKIVFVASLSIVGWWLINSCTVRTGIHDNKVQDKRSRKRTAAFVGKLQKSWENVNNWKRLNSREGVHKASRREQETTTFTDYSTSSVRVNLVYNTMITQ